MVRQYLMRQAPDTDRAASATGHMSCWKALAGGTAAALVAGLGAAVGASPARAAATVEVSTTAQLEAAVQAANTTRTPTDILVDPGTYYVGPDGGLELHVDMSITAKGPGPSVIDGSSANGVDVFLIPFAPTTVTLDGLTITGGLDGVDDESSATMTIENSTITGNQRDAFQADGESRYVFVNDTIANNGNHGMRIDTGQVTATNVTIANNGFGLDTPYTATLNNSILSNNTGGDCLQDPNLTADSSLDSDGTCSSAGDGTPGSTPGVTTGDARLGTLADNGGRTPTMALAAGSLAIDTGDDAVCPPTDQRGVTRPRGAHCDIGAYEAGDNSPPPTPSIDSHPNAPTNATSASFGFSDTRAGVSFSCSLDGVAAPCTSPTSYTPVGGGSHTFSVTASDGSGTSDPANFTWTVDTIAPSISIAVPTDNGTYVQNQTVDASYACNDAGSSVVTCSGPVATGSPIDTSTTGTHTFTVSAADAVGNASSASATYVVTAPSPPTISIVSPADNATYARNQTVVASYSCTGNGSPVTACAGPVPNGTAIDTSTLGSHSFTVTASDAAGHTISASATYTVGGIRSRIVAVRDALANSTGTNRLPSVMRAINDLNQALGARYWVDEDTLTRDGRQVFPDLHAAVDELSQVKPNQGNFNGAISSLVSAARSLASAAIQNAVNAGGKANEIKTAQNELSLGDSELAKGHDGPAIDHYGNAWQHAWSAVH